MSRDRHVFHPPHGAEPPAQVDPVVQRRSDALAYLTSERAYFERRRQQGMEPYSYLPTAEGHIASGALAWADLTPDELLWVCDEQWGYVLQARNWAGGQGDPESEKKSQAMLDAALTELRSRGGSWTPKSAPERAPLTIPDAPHTGGR